ncbi:unnamed protein product [Paramecium octaurelia]|uniref:Uncharacterized protein n=1 Tax=Paramecium octaurelia TaxID=43137 RepID=A0A8S1VZA7_PAROT|nr:unnamed protein product [Paramecium octaurelia]
MSKQKNENNIRIHQINNFESHYQMKQYADAQSMKLQASEQELTQVKGISQGGQNVLKTQILQKKSTENQIQRRPNAEAPRRINMNNAQYIIDSFKTMQLQKLQIVFKDQVRVVANLEYPQNNIVQQLLTSSKIGISIQRKEAKKLPSPIQLIQSKDQQQLELLLDQKQCEMEQLQQQIEPDFLNHKEQDDKLQLKNRQIIQYLPTFQQLIQEQSQVVEVESQNFNKRTKNNNILKRIEVLTKIIQKRQFEIIKIDLNMDDELKSLNNKLNQIGQQLNMKIHENQQFQSSQIYDQSRKVISRRHNFEQYKSSQISAQLEDQIQALRQEQQRLQFEIKEKINQSKEQQIKIQMDQEKAKSQIRNYEEDILNNNLIEEKLKKEQYELSKLQIQMQALKQELTNNQKQIKQNKEEYDNKYFNTQNQINSIQNQINDITELIKKSENQKLQLPRINQKLRNTENQMAIDVNTSNIEELIESYQNNSLGQNLKTIDEIYNQEQKSLQTLELFKISYFTKNKKIYLPYQTKWIAQDILETCDLLRDDSQEYIEQSQQSFQYITSDQINGFAELLQIKDQIYYFRLPKKIRQIYSRLYIFPSCFLEEYRLNYKQNNDICIDLILSQLEDFQAIQYQFWYIYQKIAFIIQEDTFFYIVTVKLDQRVVIIYNSIPKPEQQYTEILLCLNHLFSQLLRERIQFELHISPIFPIQIDKSNDNLSGYYACIALEYQSRNQINKGFLQMQQICAQIYKIKLKKNKSSYQIRRKQME